MFIRESISSNTTYNLYTTYIRTNVTYNITQVQMYKSVTNDTISESGAAPMCTLQQSAK